MRLSRRIILSITLTLLALFVVWAFVFYHTSKRRIYSRIDSVLSQQSEKIISRFQENDSLPRSMSGASGTMEFFIEKVSPEYAEKHQLPVFQNDEDYIDDLQDEETVRELKRVFRKHDVDYELTLTTQVFAWNDTLDFAIASIITLATLLLIAIILIVSFIVTSNMKPIYRLTHWLRNRKEGEEIPQPDDRIKVQEFKEIESAVLEASKNRNDCMKSKSASLATHRTNSRPRWPCAVTVSSCWLTTPNSTITNFPKSRKPSKR